MRIRKISRDIYFGDGGVEYPTLDLAIQSHIAYWINGRAVGSTNKSCGERIAPVWGELRDYLNRITNGLEVVVESNKPAPPPLGDINED